MDYKNNFENRTDREIKVSRIIDAPRDVVFNAYFDSDHISDWWGPKGFKTTTHHMDANPGGTWKFVMHSPDGTDFPNFIKYVDIKKPEIIVYQHGSKENDPEQFEAATIFEEVGDSTRVTMHLLFASQKIRQEMIKFGALEGGKETLERLSELLEKRQLAL